MSLSTVNRNVPTLGSARAKRKTHKRAVDSFINAHRAQFLILIEEVQPKLRHQKLDWCVLVTYKEY